MRIKIYSNSINVTPQNLFLKTDHRSNNSQNKSFGLLLSFTCFMATLYSVYKGLQPVVAYGYFGASCLFIVIAILFSDVLYPLRKRWLIFGNLLLYKAIECRNIN